MGKLELTAVALVLLYIILATSKYAENHPRTIEVKTAGDVANVTKLLEEDYKRRHPTVN